MEETSPNKNKIYLQKYEYETFPNIRNIFYFQK